MGDGNTIPIDVLAPKETSSGSKAIDEMIHDLSTVGETLNHARLDHARYDLYICI